MIYVRPRHATHEAEQHILGVRPRGTCCSKSCRPSSEYYDDDLALCEGTFSRGDPHIHGIGGDAYVPVGFFVVRDKLTDHVSMMAPVRFRHWFEKVESSSSDEDEK